LQTLMGGRVRAIARILTTLIINNTLRLTPTHSIFDNHRTNMLKGFNTDLTVRGQQYHVQTEDWGSLNPFLVSRVFKNGAVFKTVKQSHEDALKLGSINASQALEQALKQQHQRILDQLVAGQI